MFDHQTKTNTNTETETETETKTKPKPKPKPQAHLLQTDRRPAWQALMRRLLIG
jgi:hypothetical protein